MTCSFKTIFLCALIFLPLRIISQKLKTRAEWKFSCGTFSCWKMKIWVDFKLYQLGEKKRDNAGNVRTVDFGISKKSFDFLFWKEILFQNFPQFYFRNKLKTFKTPRFIYFSLQWLNQKKKKSCSLSSINNTTGWSPKNSLDEWGHSESYSLFFSG